MIRNIIILIIIGSALLACQSSPRKNYFILSATSPQSAENISNTHLGNTSLAAATLIGVGPIDVADYLDRSYIGYAADSNSLTIIDNNYWAEPLEKGIARVMLLNLNLLSPDHSFVGFPWRGDSKPHYSFRIQLHSLSRNQHQANISATWELIDNSNKSNLKRKNFNHSVRVGASTQALVQGYSILLGELAADMSQSLYSIR